jgi:hypothetical protein
MNKMFKKHPHKNTHTPPAMRFDVGRDKAAFLFAEARRVIQLCALHASMPRKAVAAAATAHTQIHRWAGVVFF